MTNWLPDIDPDDIARVRIIGVTLGSGIRADVERVFVVLHLWNGDVVQHDFDGMGMAYETWSYFVEQFNRSRRHGRSDPTA